MFRNIITIKDLVLIFAISLVIASFLQVYLEETGKSDSAGFMYSAYCSIIYSIVISIPLIIIFSIYRKYTGKKSKKAK